MQSSNTNPADGGQPQGLSRWSCVHERVRCELAGGVSVAPEHASMIVLSSNAVDTSGSMVTTVVDLSRGGIGFRTKVFLPKQARLIVKITDPAAGATDTEAALTVLVKVMRVAMVDRTPNYEIGTAFVDPTPALKEKVLALIASIARTTGQAGGAPVLEHEDYIVAALLEEGRLTAAVVDPIRRTAAEKRSSVCDLLVERGVLTSRDVALVRAQISEVAFADLDHYTIDFKNTAKVPKQLAEGLQAMPLFIVGVPGAEVATVGMANPLDLRAVDQMRALLRLEVEPVLCEPKALKALIDRAYAMVGQGESAVVANRSGDAFMDVTTGKEPIVAAVNQIIAQAVEKGASDIHLGPDETNLHLRFRVDGELAVQQGPALSAHVGIVQRLKVMANLDLTQSRRPQDGKFRFNHNGRAVDIRLSIIPTVCGENVVMRLLTSNASIRGFNELGFPAEAAASLERIIDEPHGMMLVTGPTGSGKTTTLYTCIKKLNQPGLNVMTIEDPVEIRMPMIRQVQVNTEIGMTFAGALRSMLRQDPDVVMVGEIRDEETARIAVQAALTGHLVLSSLHTNDACGAIPRLKDFGCPPFAINASLLGVMAQRLVRRACRDCAKADTPAASLVQHFGKIAEGSGYVMGAGCVRCAGSGYQGRVGVYEMLEMTPPVQKAIEDNAPIQTLRQTAMRAGFRPMWIDAVEKARLGLTTLSEVARVVAVLETNEAVAGSIVPIDADDHVAARKSA